MCVDSFSRCLAHLCQSCSIFNGSHRDRLRTIAQTERRAHATQRDTKTSKTKRKTPEKHELTRMSLPYLLSPPKQDQIPSRSPSLSPSPPHTLTHSKTKRTNRHTHSPVIEYVPYGLCEFFSESHEVQIMKKVHVRMIDIQEITRLLQK